MFLLKRFLKAFIRVGRLVVIDVDGCVHQFSSSVDKDAPSIAIRLHKRSLYWKIALHPGLYVGEAYMAGDLTVDRGSIYDFLELCGQNMALRGTQTKTSLSRLLILLVHYVTQWNSVARAHRNVAHHYDLARELYASFLDCDMQYSCAYFSNPHATLDEAQMAKRRHIAAKLLLQRNQKVLDIGSGWGGLAIDLAKQNDVRVDGITLSHEQLHHATQRAEAEGVSHDVRFELKDYRVLDRRYDRIVSVGMFEHVGVPYYRAFFSKIRSLLTTDGVALVHAIGSMDGPGFGNSFIRKYIFPGGYIPALSEVLPAIEASGLIVTDVEILRLHYAETLRHWRERFLENWDTIKHLYDERFKRMWEFYLAGCEMAFRYGGLMVFQIQLAKEQAAVPLTRDYIYQYEQQFISKRERAA